MSRLCLAAALIALSPVISRAADDPAIAGAMALIARVVPAHADQFVCEIISRDHQADGFEIESVGDR